MEVLPVPTSLDYLCVYIYTAAIKKINSICVHYFVKDVDLYMLQYKR